MMMSYDDVSMWGLKNVCVFFHCVWFFCLAHSFLLEKILTQSVQLILNCRIASNHIVTFTLPSKSLVGKI